MDKSFPGPEDDQARRATLLAEQTFFFRVNGSQRFVRKCMKSWLTRGSSNRWMTLYTGQLFSIKSIAIILRQLAKTFFKSLL